MGTFSDLCLKSVVKQFSLRLAITGNPCKILNRNIRKVVPSISIRSLRLFAKNNSIFKVLILLLLRYYVRVKKRTLFLTFPPCLFVLLLGYLWYAHASIYWKLGDLPIYAPKDFANVSIGTQTASPLTYVAIGDSLTAGVGVDSYEESYPYLVAKNIAESQKKKVHLVPLAIPGIRSEYVVGYFIEPTIASKPDIVTLLIGTNDIHGNVPNHVFKAHYEHILQRLSKETTAKIYVISIPYIGTKELISLPYQYYFNWKIQQYNVIIKDLAATYNLTYIDLYTAHAPQSLDTAYYAKDFFHPNTVGYTKWAETIYASINH